MGVGVARFGPYGVCANVNVNANANANVDVNVKTLMLMLTYSTEEPPRLVY